MKEIQISIKPLPHFEGLDLPGYQTPGSSGFDFLAACHDEIILKPGERFLVPTGLSFSIPLGTEIQVRPRSGLAVKHGITMVNNPGTVDSDYRGEVKLIMINLGQEVFTITRGMRIAQGVLAEVVKGQFNVADNLDATCRGAGGFGHTGI